MTPEQVYALLLSKINSVTSGISRVSLDGTELTILFNDNSEFTIDLGQELSNRITAIENILASNSFLSGD